MDGHSPPRPLGRSGLETTDLAPELTLEWVSDAGEWASFEPLEALLARVCGAIAGTPALASHAAWRPPMQACVAYSDDASVRELNARFRGKDYATNVLSFPASPATPNDPSPLGEPQLALGDIILACETIEREAGDLDISPSDHLQHLIVHGVLHLLGFDHEDDREAVAMEALESAILARLGIADPYASDRE